MGQCCSSSATRPHGSGGQGYIYTRLKSYDRKFPPDQRSIGKDSPIRTWRKPHELVANPKFIVQGVSRFDPNQGSIGNCWFIVALQAFANHPELFQWVVPPNQNFGPNYTGYFYVHFWTGKRWKKIFVDDYLPTSNGELIYCRNRKQPNEFWAPLLEKAFAKFYGSYERLNGGSPANALTALTGGTARNYSIKYTYTVQGSVGSWMTTLLVMMNEALEARALVISAITKRGFPRNHPLEQQLPSNHAYTITKLVIVSVHDLNDQRYSNGQDLYLIRIRNPWGNGTEWKGDWSDGSWTWYLIPEHIQQQLGLFRGHEDGEFWMSFHDFYSHFDLLTICDIPYW